MLISCWPKSNIIIKIKQQYGHDSLKLVRKLEKTYLKLKKNELDFLKQCQAKHLIPSFCKLKPINRKGLSQKDDCSLQYKVLTLQLMPNTGLNCFWIKRTNSYRYFSRSETLYPSSLTFLFQRDPYRL